MKTLRLISGQEYLILDEESDYLSDIIIKGKTNFITLSNGDVININSISKVGSLDKVKHWGGYVLRKDGRSFLRGGDVVWLDGNEIIEEMDDPKYKLMPIINLKQLK